MGFHNLINTSQRYVRSSFSFVGDGAGGGGGVRDQGGAQRVRSSRSAHSSSSGTYSHIGVHSVASQIRGNRDTGVRLHSNGRVHRYGSAQSSNSASGSGFQGSRYDESAFQRARPKCNGRAGVDRSTYGFGAWIDVRFCTSFVHSNLHHIAWICMLSTWKTCLFSYSSWFIFSFASKQLYYNFLFLHHRDGLHVIRWKSHFLFSYHFVCQIAYKWKQWPPQWRILI